MNDRNEKIEGDVEIKVKTPFSAWLDNFWYHYKWHTIVAAFVIIVGVLLTVQMCSKVSYDLHILYAGDARVSPSREGGDLSEYEKTLMDLKKITPDINGDGECEVDFLNLFVANDEELALLREKGESTEGAETLIREDSETLSFSIVSGDYYIMLLSERLFLEYAEQYGDSLFAPLSEYATDAEVDFVSGTLGIRLSSIEGFASLPAISALDTEDTVICLRAVTEVSAFWNKSRNEKNFEAAEAALIAILEYGK